MRKWFEKQMWAWILKITNSAVTYFCGLEGLDTALHLVSVAASPPPPLQVEMSHPA